MAAILAVSAPLAARAQDGSSADGALRCTVEGTTVYLRWEIVWLVPIEGYIVVRDNEKCSPGEKCYNWLPPEASEYVDKDAGPGEHTYVLSAVQTNGDVGEVGRCTVVVPGSGLACAVEGRMVRLKWEPLDILVVIRAFEIYRNGDLIGKVPGDQFAYDDSVPTVGEYAYKVAAVVSETTSFPIGSCEVSVPCFNMDVTVEGLKVNLAWRFPTADPWPINTPIPIDPTFIVLRDGEGIGKTGETSFTDEVPAPGRYVYEVGVVLGTSGIASTYIIAACRVVVPPYPPPPQDLVCLVGHYPDPLPADMAGTVDATIPPAPDTAILVWLNPIVYDAIVIYRDGEEYAKLPGTRDWFLDIGVPPGLHIYAVVGVKGNLMSRPVRCEVLIPGWIPAPPQDLRCIVLREVDPEPVEPVDIYPDDATTPVPIGPKVLMSWTNGDDYDAILILRDDGLLVTLRGGPAGEVRRFLDRAPPAGERKYCVVGVAKDLKSLPACCAVTVPGPFPPRPQDLTCRVLSPAPDDATEIGDDVLPIPQALVLLDWVDPIAYDRIVISRNGMVIATLEGTATSFRDRVRVGGTYLYSVVGVKDGLRSRPAQCSVEVPPIEVPPPQDLTCTLLDIILQPDDPDIEANDVEVPAAGEPVALRAVVLRWWNPIRYAGIVVFRDGAEIAQLPGDAMGYRDFNPAPGLHVYGVVGVLADGRQSDVATCEIFVAGPVPPVDGLTCSVLEKYPPDVALAWKNPADYDRIIISRNRVVIAELPGDATSYLDPDLPPGVSIYAVVAVIGNARSLPARCQVVIEGPPEKNLLYFSSGAIEPTPGPAPTNRITCLATNAAPLQGWSFGVGSDPKFVVPDKYDLDGTVTAGFNGGQGPDFIVVDLYPEGVTMAVVIDNGATGAEVETLPPGAGQHLLNIEYAAGPSGAHGELYEVVYSEALGSPPVQVLFVVDGFEVRPATLPGWVAIPAVRFIRGDVDGSGLTDITDPINLLGWLFLGAKEPGCMQACDANGSGSVNIADAMYLFQFLFMGGPVPPSPFPECGGAPVPLGCGDQGSCD